MRSAGRSRDAATSHTGGLPMMQLPLSGSHSYKLTPHTCCLSNPNKLAGSKLDLGGVTFSVLLLSSHGVNKHLFMSSQEMSAKKGVDGFIRHFLYCEQKLSPTSFGNHDNWRFGKWQTEGLGVGTARGIQTISTHLSTTFTCPHFYKRSRIIYLAPTGCSMLCQLL